MDRFFIHVEYSALYSALKWLTGKRLFCEALNFDEIFQLQPHPLEIGNWKFWDQAVAGVREIFSSRVQTYLLQECNQE